MVIGIGSLLFNIYAHSLLAFNSVNIPFCCGLAVFPLSYGLWSPQQRYTVVSRWSQGEPVKNV